MNGPVLVSESRTVRTEKSDMGQVGTLYNGNRPLTNIYRNMVVLKTI